LAQVWDGEHPSLYGPLFLSAMGRRGNRSWQSAGPACRAAAGESDATLTSVTVRHGEIVVNCKLNQVAAVKQQLLSGACADAELATVAKRIVDQALRVQLMVSMAAPDEQVETMADGIRVLHQATDMSSTALQTLRRLNEVATLRRHPAKVLDIRIAEEVARALASMGCGRSADTSVTRQCSDVEHQEVVINDMALAQLAELERGNNGGGNGSSSSSSGTVSDDTCKEQGGSKAEGKLEHFGFKAAAGPVRWPPGATHDDAGKKQKGTIPTKHATVKDNGVDCGDGNNKLKRQLKLPVSDASTAASDEVLGDPGAKEGVDATVPEDNQTETKGAAIPEAMRIAFAMLSPDERETIRQHMLTMTSDSEPCEQAVLAVGKLRETMDRINAGDAARDDMLQRSTLERAVLTMQRGSACGLP